MFELMELRRGKAPIACAQWQSVGAVRRHGKVRPDGAQLRQVGNGSQTCTGDYDWGIPPQTEATVKEHKKENMNVANQTPHGEARSPGKCVSNTWRGRARATSPQIIAKDSIDV